MTFEIQAQSRPVQGTGASRRLRRDGILPGIVYGGAQAPLSITLDHNTLYYTLQEEAFHSTLIGLSIDGSSVPEQVLLRAVQYHPYKQQVLHIDFQRVDKDTQVERNVPLHFIHTEDCPGVKLQGGTVTRIMSEVRVRCMATQLPAFIEVDLGHLSASHPGIHLSDLRLPEGVKVVRIRGNDTAVASLIGAKTAE